MVVWCLCGECSLFVECDLSGFIDCLYSKESVSLQAPRDFRLGSDVELAHSVTMISKGADTLTLLLLVVVFVP